MGLTDVEVAVAAARAGAEVVATTHPNTRTAKAPTDFATETDSATETDIAAEEAIVHLLKTHRPADARTGEESGDSGPHQASRVSQLAAEHRSHGLDDALELYALQLEVEQVLCEEFPAAFDEHIASWAEREALAEHHPRVVVESCSLCQAIAKHLGGGTDAPLAA